MTSIDDNDDNAVGWQRNVASKEGVARGQERGRTCCGSVPDVSNRLVNKMSTFFRMSFFRVLQDLLFLFSPLLVVAGNLIESTLW